MAKAELQSLAPRPDLTLKLIEHKLGTSPRHAIQDGDNPAILLADIMQKKRLGVFVGTELPEPRTIHEIPRSLVHILFVNSKSRQMYESILSTPELSALSDVFSTRYGRFGADPKMENCQWDDTTKTRLKALKTINDALFLRDLGQADNGKNGNKWQLQMAEELEAKAVRNTDHFPDQDELRSLIYNVFERETSNRSGEQSSPKKPL